MFLIFNCIRRKLFSILEHLSKKLEVVSRETLLLAQRPTQICARSCQKNYTITQQTCLITYLTALSSLMIIYFSCQQQIAHRPNLGASLSPSTSHRNNSTTLVQYRNMRYFQHCSNRTDHLGKDAFTTSRCLIVDVAVVALAFFLILLLLDSGVSLRLRYLGIYLCFWITCQI